MGFESQAAKPFGHVHWFPPAGPSFGPERSNAVRVPRGGGTSLTWHLQQTKPEVGSAQGIGDLYRMYLQTERDGVDHNLAYIPPDFTAVHQEEFDTEFMRQLFDHGYRMSQQGYPWQKFPPSYSDGE